ncbi:MAG TPA: hypothetical protein VHS96_18115, partial [Bacteroidia bacterium]|nr:hypothetical protein [Bacteroidia bacterium]
MWLSCFKIDQQLAEEHQQQVPKSGPTPGAADRELGFGNKVYGKRVRMINPDGSTNVLKRGRSWIR